MARDLAQIDVVHQPRCPHGRDRCRCSPSYRVQVWDGRAKKLHRKTFKTYPEAKTWRDDVRIALREGTLRPRIKVTVAQAAGLLLEGMTDGSWLDRSGRVYKPSTCRSYSQAVTKYVEPDPLARFAMTDVRRADIQDYVDRLRKKGLSASTIANKLDPIRVIFRRALQRDEISVDPTDGLVLPAVRGRRERIADRSEAASLIAALPVSRRAFWATAIYAGCGEASYAPSAGATSTSMRHLR